MVLYVLYLLIPMYATQISASSRTQDPPHVEHYSIKSHLYSWDVTKINLPVTRCLVISTNQTSTSVICDQLYNHTQMEDIIEITSKHKALIGNLDLSCALQEHTGQELYKTCVCANVKLGGTTQLDIPTNLSVSGEYQTESTKSGVIRGLTFDTCSYPSTLGYNMLQGYTQLHILNIQDLPIEIIQKETFSDFQETLQILFMKNIPLRENLISPGLLCEMTSLHFVLMNNFTEEMNTFPTSMFTCNQSDQIPGLGSLLGVFANGNKFQTLPSLLVGTGARSLIVLNLTNNGIDTVSRDAFKDMVNLKELNLDNNNISALPTGLFSSLSSLKYLSLQNNKLRHLDLSLLRPLRMVTELYLSGNRLQTIQDSFNILPSLEKLYLQDNEFREINDTMFLGCYRIRELYLDHNYISYIDSKAFSSLLFLGKLHLSYNRLSNSTNLQLAFHGKLENLAYLGLAHNQLTELLPGQFQKRPYLHNLRILDLAFNEINTIHEDSFQDMDKVFMIRLFHNNISHILVNTFRRLLKLQHLWIDINQLEEIPDDAFPPEIVWLSLGENNIRQIPYVSTPLSKLQDLHMGYNNMSRLNKTMFTNFPNLKILNLTHCNLLELDGGTFEDLKNLEVLDLSKNYLNLDFSVDYLGNIFKVSYLNLSNNIIQSAENLFQHHIKYADVLDISSNPLNVFPDQPKRDPFGESSFVNYVKTSHMYVRNCSLTYINPKAFELLPNLVHLDFSLNNLHSLDRLEIVQEVKDHYFVFLYDNPIRCNCHTSWLILPPYNSYYKLSHCLLVTSDELVSFDEITSEQFLCREVLNCLVEGTSCQCFTDDAIHKTVIYVRCNDGSLSSIPRNIPVTSNILDLHGNQFSTLSFEHIPDRIATTDLHLNNCSIAHLTSSQFKKFYLLELLDLSFNDIVELQTGVFRGLYKLQTLYLNHNHIHILLPGIFRDIIGSLHILTLHDNELVTINDETMSAMDELPYLQNLSLHNNPWECQCDNGTFKHWLQEKTDIIHMSGSIQCNYTDILTLPDDAFICYDTRVYVERYYKTAVVTTSVLATALSVLLCTIIVCNHYKKLIYVLIYYKFGWRWNKIEDLTCQYDGFVVYTNMDTNVPRWVRLELLENLEPPYRLFIPDRDSIPGLVRSEEIITTIKESRRTIFLLTEDSIIDDFFLFTFHTAYGYSNESENHHRLILILMEGVDIKQHLNDLDPHLQAFIKTKQYIKLNDKRLWKKLLYEMPDPPEQDSNMTPLPGFIHNELHCSNALIDVQISTKQLNENDYI